MDSEQNIIKNTLQQAVNSTPLTTSDSGELLLEISLPVGIFYVDTAKNKV